MARGGGNDAESLEQLRAFGIAGDDRALLGLLKAADYNVERAVNHYFDVGAPKLPSPPPSAAKRKAQAQLGGGGGRAAASSASASASASKEGTVEVIDILSDDEEEEAAAAAGATAKPVAPQEQQDAESAGMAEGEEEEGAAGSQRCKHGRGADCGDCGELQNNKEKRASAAAASAAAPDAGLTPGEAALLAHVRKELKKPELAPEVVWPKVLGQRVVEDAYSTTRDKSVRAGEKVYIHVEATAQTLNKRASSSAAGGGGGGGGGGRGTKRMQAREEQRKAASIRFRTEGGVEGRLPTDIASVLMPLLAASDHGGGAAAGPLAPTARQGIQAVIFPCPTFRERAKEGTFGGQYVRLEAQAVASIYRTQLFTKVPIRLRVLVDRGFFDIFLPKYDNAPPPTARTQPRPAGGAAVTRLVRESISALINFLGTGKVEVPAPDKGDTERRMIGAASSSSSSSASAAAAAPAEEEGEEGPTVDENQLERLYRLNEAAYMALPEFAGPVTGLRGLELRPYQRQALAWMLRREGDVDGEEEGARAGKRRRSGGGGQQALGVHLEMGRKEEDEEEEEEEDVVEVVGGGGGGKASSSRTQVWLHQGLVQVAHCTAKRLAAVSSFHPLWDRHFLALPLGCGFHLRDNAQGLGFPLPFYSNPYSKRLSLAVPPPPQPCKGGILADDMGMGKTIMVLSLILESKARALRRLAPDPTTSSTYSSSSGSGKGKRGRRDSSSGLKGGAVGGPTLVVVPLSVLSQWHREIQAFSAPQALAVSVYYGPDRPADPNFLRSQDVVISTYGTLQSDYAAATSPVTRGLGAAAAGAAGDGNAADGSITGAKTGLYGVRWGRVVLDEAHNIKNRGTDTYRAAQALGAERRWCLTGTPIQNTLGDVFALLRFLRHEPWSDVTWWRRVIEEPFGKGDESALERLRNVLAPLLLRRTKASKDREGRPIVQLPKREVTLVEVEFSEPERAFYDSLKARSRLEFEGFVREGTHQQSYAQILYLLLRLRQACDHPFLVLGRALEEATAGQAEDDDGAGGAEAAEAAADEAEMGRRPAATKPAAASSSSSSAAASVAANPLDREALMGPAAAAASEGGAGAGGGAVGRGVTASFIRELYARFTRQQQQQQQKQQKQQQRGLLQQAVQQRLTPSKATAAVAAALAAGVASAGPSPSPAKKGPAYFQSVAAQLQAAGGLEAAECPICLTEPPEDPVVTPCCHIMCRACLYDAINYQPPPADASQAASQPQPQQHEGDAECPVCRASIREGDLLRITDGIAPPSPPKPTAPPTPAAADTKAGEGAKAAAAAPSSGGPNVAADLMPLPGTVETEAPPPAAAAGADAEEAMAVVVEEEGEGKGGGAGGRPRRGGRKWTVIDPPSDEEEDEEEDDSSEEEYLGGSDDDEIVVARRASGGRGRRGKGRKGKARAAPAKKPALVELLDDDQEEEGAKNKGGNLLEDLEGDEVVRGSAKLKRLMQELQRLVFTGNKEAEGEPPVKAVVFSQWTFMLDLIEKALKARGWGYARLDGGTPQAKREAALVDFASKRSVRVMVISLKAGGVGLNLTSANICFLMDPWWNPAMEDQAIDRVHRLGQRCDVQVFRFTVRDTVEQQMLVIQEKKAAIARNALACFGGKDKDEGRLNLEELRRFFL